MIKGFVKKFIADVKAAYNTNLELAEKRKKILNIAHPSKFLVSEDHAYFHGSSCCPLCSIYNGRVFSISGKDKRFPPLVSLPDEIHDNKCDVCNGYYTLCVWFGSIKTTSEIKAEIKNSNAPLVDRRTPEQIEAFAKDQAKAARKKAKQNKEEKT